MVVLTKSLPRCGPAHRQAGHRRGGQTVDIDYDAGTVAVDGVVLEGPYINEAMLCPTYENPPMCGAGGSIFVMGDNRNHSSDSRDVTLGTVDERYVLGRALCVLLPFKTSA